MKKIIAFILLMCMVLSIAACADNESTPPEITLQEVYDAGKNLVALLGDHESVYVQITSNGKVVREEYLCKQYCYSYSSAEYMDMGFEYADFTTDHAEYVYFDNNYLLNVTLTTSGMVDMKERFAAVGTVAFVSSEVTEAEEASIIEKDGSIIVTYKADLDKIQIMGEDVASCVETYTLDVKTREMTSVKTVYTYKDGTVEEGIATITRDVEAPEGVKEFIKLEKETQNLRTVTFVFNPGTANEKTESIQVAKGLQIGFSPDWSIEKAFTVYADAACTQAIEGELDVNSDLTVYIKWGE